MGERFLLMSRSDNYQIDAFSHTLDRQCHILSTPISLFSFFSLWLGGGGGGFMSMTRPHIKLLF